MSVEGAIAGVYLITRLYGLIVGVSGPLPMSMDECQARVVVVQIELEPKEARLSCEKHRIRPSLERLE